MKARRATTVLTVVMLLGLVAMATGCGKLVTVNSYLDPAPGAAPAPGSSFCLLDQNPPASNPVVGRTLAAKISRLLVHDGFSLDDARRAQYLLTFVLERSTRGGTEYVAVQGPGRQVEVTEVDKDGKRTTTTVEEPGPVDYMPLSVAYITDVLHLVIYVNRQDGAPIREMAVATSDASMTITVSAAGALEYAPGLDYLVVGGMLALGRNTGQAQRLLIKDDNPSLRLLQDPALP